MSGQLPALTPKDLLRILQKEGFFVHRSSGSHFVLKHPDRPRVRVTLPIHNRDLKKGTLRSILDQLGYTVKDFQKFLD